MVNRILDINDETFLHKGFAPDVELDRNFKRSLYVLMEENGMPRATTCRRFISDKGFDKWELIGIDMLKRLFLNSAVPVSDDVLTGMGQELEGLKPIDDKDAKALLEKDIADWEGEHSGDRGFLAVLALEDGLDIDKPNEFYAFLTRRRYGMMFRKWMMERGMSWTTVRTRFSDETWKSWERKGINSLMSGLKVDVAPQKDEKKERGGKHHVAYSSDRNSDDMLQIHVLCCRPEIVESVAEWLTPLWEKVEVDRRKRWNMENGKTSTIITITFHAPGKPTKEKEQDVLKLFEARLLAGYKREFGNDAVVSIKKMKTEKLINL